MKNYFLKQLKKNILMTSIGIFGTFSALASDLNDEKTYTVPKLIFDAADSGNAKAQFILAESYILGHGVERNKEKAFAYLEKAAENDHPKALYEMGLSHELGRFVEKNYDKSINFYERAIQQKNGDAALPLGILLSNKKDYIGAAAMFSIAAQRYPVADYHLGLMYLVGQGVEKNVTLAVDKLCNAMNTGFPSAAIELGKIYSEGRHVTQNYDIAASMYHRGAQHGSPDAAFHLGMMYHRGLISADNGDNENIAKYLFQQSANAGHLAAKSMLETL